VHVAILGAGGLGLVVGARLAESGVRVSLVARPAHVAAIDANGLHVTGISGDRVVRTNLAAYERADDIAGEIDWLAVMVKTRDTGAALAEAAEVRGRVAGVFSLQNSVAKDDALVRWIGPRHVIGASTTEAGVLTGHGAARHTATAPTAFYFGELDGRPSARVDTLAATFTAAGLAARPTDVIAQVEWEKLLQISAVAGFCASTIGFAPDASFAHGIAVRPGAEHYVQLVRELLSVYCALGYAPQDFYTPFANFRRAASATFDDAVDDAVALGAEMLCRGIIGRPSLHEDLVRGRPTELDDCLGAFLLAARERGIDVPTVRAAYRVIATLESLAKGTPT
jgi:2-dehydropantoate 2-reductase